MFSIKSASILKLNLEAFRDCACPSVTALETFDAFIILSCTILGSTITSLSAISSKLSFNSKTIFLGKPNAAPVLSSRVASSSPGYIVSPGVK